MNSACKEFYAEQSVKKQLNTLGLLSSPPKIIPSSAELPLESNLHEVFYLCF